ncbi:hypothetical protein ACVWYF_001243 [Hymenobacter sp. UYAg731]
MTIGFNHRKTTQALNFFASKEGGAINKMKALKLLWIADRLHVRKYGRLISNDTYFAMPRGPVASGARDIMNHTSYLSEEERVYSEKFVSDETRTTFRSIADVELKVFSKTDHDAIIEAYNSFGKSDEQELSELSHVYPEWKRFETRLQAGMASRYEIDFLDFFANPSEANHSLFSENLELLELSKEVFCGVEAA